MTNLEKWRLYLKDIEAPDSFIDWSFYWMISASLQRRVWWGADRQLFPNFYLFLVAEPGIGKGVSLNPVKDCLEWHKLKDKGPFDEESIYQRIIPQTFSGRTVKVEHAADATMNLLIPNSTKQNESKSGDTDEHAQLFPTGADCTTFEQLIHDFARSTRAVKYFKVDANGNRSGALYTHNTMAIISTELNNFVKKNTENIVNFMLKAYDCESRYEYRTKNMGKDLVTKVCLNFAAGTTPQTMANLFSSDLLDEGMSARSFFIFAFANRHFRFNINGITEEQLRGKASVLSWLRKLSGLYGEVKLTKEAEDYMTFWYENVHPQGKANKDAKLIHYYSRKKVHVLKFAMAMHFAEETSMELSLDTCKKALAMLEEAEKYMHLALQISTKNPLANVARNITRYFIARANEPASFTELLSEFYTEARTEDLQEIINYMVTTGKLIVESNNGTTMYKVNPEKRAEEQVELASDKNFTKASHEVHPTLHKGIRWGKGRTVLIATNVPLEEINKLRRLMTEGVIKDFKSVKFRD